MQLTADSVSHQISYYTISKFLTICTDDDWTVITEDGSLSAHYENTILITDGEPEILTLTEDERVLMQNGGLGCE